MVNFCSMARVGVIKVLEYRLGYSSMVNYRYVRAIVINCRYNLTRTRYVEYLGSVKHGWCIDRMLARYCTYEYGKKYFAVHRLLKFAHVSDFLILNVSRVEVYFKWYVGPGVKYKISDMVTYQRIITDRGRQIRPDKPVNFEDSLYKILSQMVKVLRGDASDNPYTELC